MTPCMPRRLLMLAASVTLLAAPPSLAQDQIAPPGNAGVDEYLETVPSAEGNRRPRVNEDAPQRSRPAVPQGARQKLEDLGADGQAAAELAEQGAPETPAGASGGSTGRGDASGGDASGGDAPGADEPGGSVAGSAESLSGARGDSGVGAVVGRTVVGEDGGLGVALPLILGISLLGAVLLLVARRVRGKA
jgi:hypothetical protein